MGENSAIEWTDHTFNPWVGCTKVSPGCAHCYAEHATFVRAQRKHGRELWGEGRERWRTSEETWHKPLVWNDRAKALAVRQRVFCASLSDWLDDAVPIEWLADLLTLIYATPNLDWLLLTKRPENFRARVAAASDCKKPIWAGNLPQGERALPSRAVQWETWASGTPPANVWLGTTVEDQVRADERVPLLLGIPACVRFLSCEPLLGPVDLDGFLPWRAEHQSQGLPEPLCGALRGLSDVPGVEWVICGGESGHEARPMHPDWARSIRDQCATAGVAFFFKQWGEYAPRAAALGQSAGWDGMSMQRVGKKAAGRLLDGREWNQFPEVSHAGV